MLMVLVVALFFENSAKAETVNTYTEKVLGKPYKMGSSYLECMPYGEKKNDVGFLNLNPLKKLSFCSVKNGRITNTYYWIAKKYMTEENCYIRKGNTIFVCCNETGEGMTDMKLTVLRYKRGKRTGKFKIPATNFLSKKEKKRSSKKKYYYTVKADHIYYLSKNKIRLLYQLECPNKKKSEAHNGYADVNLKTGRVKKRAIVDFVPENIEGGFITGIDEQKNFVVARAGTGKRIMTIPAEYGVNANENYALPAGVTEKTFLSAYDFQSGNVMFANVSGIYYASVAKKSVEKIMDYKNMEYFKGDENSRYLSRIVMKDSKDFYVVYSDSSSLSDQIYDYLVRYNKNKNQNI